MATFAELESAGKPDVLVPGKAHVVRAWDARSVNTRYGDKMVRNLILNDGSADLRASWWNPADLDSDLAGRKVELIAFRKDNKNAGVRTTMGQDQQGNPRLELTASGGYLKLLEEELPGISEPTAPVQTGAPAQRAGRVTQRELMALSENVAAHARTVLGIDEESSVAAIINTYLIAATRGNLTIEPVAVTSFSEGEDAPPPDDDDIPF
jgi:hypothetical protein